MKAVIAEKSGDKVWAKVRLPLVELNDAQRVQLVRDLGIPNAAELADGPQRPPAQLLTPA